MPERWIIRGARPGFATPAMAVAKISIVSALLIGTGNMAVAATHGVSSATEKNRQELACRADIQRFCSEANLTQECLVARWDKISAGCRSALGSSSGDRPRGGS